MSELQHLCGSDSDRKQYPEFGDDSPKRKKLTKAQRSLRSVSCYDVPSIPCNVSEKDSPTPHVADEGLKINSQQRLPFRMHRRLKSEAFICKAEMQSTTMELKEGQEKPTVWTTDSILSSQKPSIPRRWNKPPARKFDTSMAWCPSTLEYSTYNLKPLKIGAPVIDLWDEDGSVLVYLSPSNAHKSPSFRVSEKIFRESKVLEYLTKSDGRRKKHIADCKFCRTSKECSESVVHCTSISDRSSHLKTLFIPHEMGLADRVDCKGEEQELEMLVLYRNVFAFLAGGKLVVTERFRSVTKVLLAVGIVLANLQFKCNPSPLSMSTLTVAFDRYYESLQMVNVHLSIQKNLEAFALAEVFKSRLLYDAAFVHAVGRLQQTPNLIDQILPELSPNTKTKLEHATLQLQNRFNAVRSKILKADFPSMFDGIISTRIAMGSSPKALKAWRKAFTRFRQFTLAYWRVQFGSWPPKHNRGPKRFGDDGLDRLVLKKILSDCSDLYDFLVDTRHLANRYQAVTRISETSQYKDDKDAIPTALRAIQQHHDYSSPPVVPPIPFDLPLLPSNANNDDKISHSQDDLESTKLTTEEQDVVLQRSYNIERTKITPWLQSFMNFERTQKTQSLTDLINGRCGRWLFLYALLQTLPLVAVDTPGVNFTPETSYLLCSALPTTYPWSDHLTPQTTSVDSIEKAMPLSPDAVDQSVEAIFQRSHCWKRAAQWLRVSPKFGTKNTGLTCQLARTNKNPLPSELASSGRVLATSLPRSQVNEHAPRLNWKMRRRASRSRRIVSEYAQVAGCHKAASSPEAMRRVSQPNPKVTFDTILEVS